VFLKSETLLIPRERERERERERDNYGYQEGKSNDGNNLKELRIA
jgi:hypothetical protein